MPVPRAELERRMDRFVEAGRRSGIKLTHQRTEIFREVAGSDEHPDAETVYQRVCKRVTGISRDTVYRTLATLESEGLIRRTEVLGGPTRYDANTERHHHFVCTKCGLVKDFSRWITCRSRSPWGPSAASRPPRCRSGASARRVPAESPRPGGVRRRSVCLRPIIG